MTPAQQHRTLGVAIHADGDIAIVQVGTQMTALRPDELRTLLREGARAYVRARIAELDGDLHTAVRQERERFGVPA
jgi:hypothetical protein